MNTAKKLLATLAKNKLSLALAESASAGYASFSLTKTPGASKVFKGGVIVYSLEAKNILLKLPQSSLIKTQGVSKNIAISLAKKVRKKLKADIGGSLVGFAGPTTKGKIKVGTFFIAVSYKGKVAVKKLTLRGSRDQLRKRVSRLLIELIHKKIK